MTGEQRQTWHIPHQAQAVSAARHAVRKTLADWGCEHAVDDITLIVSELVTNAVRHGAPDITFTMCAVASGLLYGQVVDYGPGMPHLVDAETAAEHGRGLALVMDMAWTLGWHRTSDGGKNVWFVYRLEGS